MNRQELIAAMESVAAEKPRKVDVKGWGTIYIRALTVAEVEAQNEDTEAPLLDDQGKKVVDATGKPVTVKVRDKNRLARAACRVLCDEDGTRLFDPENVSDVALLAKQPWKLLSKVLKEDDSGN